MNKDLKEKFGFTLAEGATHVGISHNIGGTLHRFVDSFTHVGISHNTRRVAFTLAEVLITLSIIGIVSAMTIPNLISKYQERVTVTKVKQAYSMLSQAYLYAINENGPVSSWNLGTGSTDPQSHINLANYFKPYLKISADCIGKDENYTRKYCKTIDPNTAMKSNIVLSNGVSTTFRVLAPNCNHTHLMQNTCATISIGFEPYEGGKSSFGFILTPNGVVPAGSVKSNHQKFELYCNPAIKENVADIAPMSACTAWVIYNGNLDYLRCFDKLSWDGKHKCDD